MTNHPNHPQGAQKGIGITTLNWLKSMPFQDRAELTEWLLKPKEGDPIRPRTESELRAYINGMVEAILTTQDQGLESAKDELRILVEAEGYLRAPVDEPVGSPVPPDDKEHNDD